MHIFFKKTVCGYSCGVCDVVCVMRVGEKEGARERSLEKLAQP